MSDSIIDVLQEYGIKKTLEIMIFFVDSLYEKNRDLYLLNLSRDLTATLVRYEKR